MLGCGLLKRCHKRRAHDERQLENARPVPKFTTLPATTTAQIEKLSPQEHEAFAFGFVNLNPPAINALE